MPVPVHGHADYCCDGCCHNSDDFGWNAFLPCPLFHALSPFPLFTFSLMPCPVNGCADSGSHYNCNNPCHNFHCLFLHSHFLPFLFFLRGFCFPLPFFPFFFLSVFFAVSSSMRISRIVSSPSVETYASGRLAKSIRIFLPIYS